MYICSENLNLARNMNAYERPLTDIPFMRRAIFFMNKICGIYKITSPSGKVYIGQSIDVHRRFIEYKASCNCKGQIFLYRSLKKYGWDKHTKEIFECDENKLNEMEKYYVDLFQTFNSKHGMNLRDGGGGHGKMSEESKEKNRQTQLSRTPEQRKQRRDMMKEKGIQNGRAKGTFNLTQEHKDKVSRARRGMSLPETQKKNIGLGLKKAILEGRKTVENNPQTKIILNTQNGIFYYGIKSAANSFGLNPNTLKGILHHYKFNYTPFIYA